jgi:hypothetical protein
MGVTTSSTSAITYEPIQSYTFSGQSSITFSSIPSTYTDLIIVWNGTSSALQATRFRYNGDTGSNYSWTRLLGDGSSASAYSLSSQNTGVGGWAGSSQVANIVQIMNYANTTTYKTSLVRMNAANDGYVGAFVNLWRSTSAINSIYIAPDSGGTFNNGNMTLYGIKAA